MGYSLCTMCYDKGFVYIISINLLINIIIITSISHVKKQRLNITYASSHTDLKSVLADFRVPNIHQNVRLHGGNRLCKEQ